MKYNFKTHQNTEVIVFLNTSDCSQTLVIDFFIYLNEVMIIVCV